MPTEAPGFFPAPTIPSQQSPEISGDLKNDQKVRTSVNWRDMIIGALIGAVITFPVEAGMHYLLDAWHKTEKILDQANKDRHLMTELGFEAARLEYQSVIDHAGLTHHLKVRAYQGMSRTYSEWAIARFARGLSRKQYPELAQKYAFLAQKEAPGDLETGLAIAYSYLAQETGSAQRSLTQAEATQLLVNHPRNVELLFLAQEPSFYDNANTGTTDNFLILLNLWTYFARKAQNTSDPTERSSYIGRAEEFLNVADRINPNNEIVYYRRGYLAQSLRGEWNKAAEYYEAALRKQPEFPQANLNLAAIYASWGQYIRTKEQFHEVIADDDVPIESRAVALHNLGEVNLELKDIPGACDAWMKATALENTTNMERLLSVVHAAMCDYAKHDLSGAKTQYKAAVELAQAQNLNLLDLTAYKLHWKVGPSELDMAEKLNKLAAQK